MPASDRHDDLVRRIDSFVARGDWDALELLGQQCRSAPPGETPRVSTTVSVAALCDYHLMLGAPASAVARVLNDDPDESPFGPLPEVAACGQTWATLGPLLSAAAADFAGERAVRGEIISPPPPRTDAHFGVPLALQTWEPAYALADYRRDDTRFPAPAPPMWTETSRLPPAGEAIGDPHVVDAFHDLMRGWRSTDSGRLDIVTAEGDHLHAISALGHLRVLLAPISFEEALRWLAWAGASGGRSGRRRGASMGRSLAWTTVASLAGVSEDWPIDPREMGEIGEGLQWFLWNEPEAGEWVFRLAVHDDVEELGFAISADIC